MLVAAGSSGAYSFGLDTFTTDPFGGTPRWERIDAECVDYDGVEFNVDVGDIDDAINCGATTYTMGHPPAAIFTATQADDMQLFFSVRFDERSGATGGPVIAWAGFLADGIFFESVSGAAVAIRFSIDLSANCAAFAGFVRYNDDTFDQTGDSDCDFAYNTFYGGEVRFVGGAPASRELDVRLGTEWTNQSLQNKAITVEKVVFETESGLFLEETIDNVAISTGDLGFGGGGGSGVETQALVSRGIAAFWIFIFVLICILMVIGAWKIRSRWT